jgi:hypothetical protein
LVGVESAALNGLEGDMDTDDRSMIALLLAAGAIDDVPQIP